MRRSPTKARFNAIYHPGKSNSQTALWSEYDGNAVFSSSSRETPRSLDGAEVSEVNGHRVQGVNIYSGCLHAVEEENNKAKRTGA